MVSKKLKGSLSLRKKYSGKKKGTEVIFEVFQPLPFKNLPRVKKV